jgi:hypothetical protein
MSVTTSNATGAVSIDDPSSVAAKCATQVAASVEECPICMCEQEEPCRTKCGHTFCGACLKKSFPPEAPAIASKCPLCRGTISLFASVDIATGEPLKKPAVSTPFGTVFLQGGEAGVAAYHFDAPDACYISYESAPAAWKLDDGSPLSGRKAFVNPAYDESTRTFTGTIEWAPATIDGNARWVYMMTFSESLNIISSGVIRQFKLDGTLSNEQFFPRQLVYWRSLSNYPSIHGASFIQGGQLGLASYHFPEVSVAGAYISYEHAPPEWRLDDGSHPPAKKLFLSPYFDATTRTFTGCIDWSEQGGFGGDARWEYEMVFSKEYDSIVGGCVRNFKPDGTEGRPHKFGRRSNSIISRLLASPQLNYERHDEARSEMVALLGALENDRPA